MGSKYKSYHPCQMAAASINQYMNHNVQDDSYDNMIGYCFRSLNALSGMIKAHPNSKVKKSRLYMIKNMFTYFMYTICTPYDRCKDLHHSFRVKKSNVYHYGPNPTYELRFYTPSVQYYITVQDNADFAPGYLKEYFNDFTGNYDTNNEPENDYSNMSDHDVYLFYIHFINWCVKHKWFFTMFYDEMAVFYHLRKIYNDTIYHVHLDPFSSSVMKMFNRPYFYAYRINPTTHIIEATRLNVRDIRDAFLEPDIVWKPYQDYIKALHTGHTYTLSYKTPQLPGATDEISEYQDLPKDIANAIMHICNAVSTNNQSNKRLYLINNGNKK